MDPKDLRYFIAAYDMKSFSRASETLRTVQSNVSYHVLRLERALGERLFERRWRGLVPTEAGDKFYVTAKRALSEISGVERDYRLSRLA